MEQKVRFCTTLDGVNLAYANSGKGPPLIRVANWLTHLELDWKSPIWSHWFREFSRDHTLIRFDHRGSGLSDYKVEEQCLEAWVQDLESVVDEVGIEQFPCWDSVKGEPLPLPMQPGIQNTLVI